MAYYDWKCDDCAIYWEREYSLGKNPHRTRCPQCRKLSERHFHGKAPAVHFKGAGWSKTTGYNRTGGSDEVNKNLQEQCKDRMKSGWQNYAKYEPSKEWIDQAGGRALNDKELSEKLESAKKFSARVYDKAGINPHNKYKPQ